jgi:hypothetical protein
MVSCSKLAQFFYSVKCAEILQSGMILIWNSVGPALKNFAWTTPCLQVCFRLQVRPHADHSTR